MIKKSCDTLLCGAFKSKMTKKSANSAINLYINK